MATRGPGQRPVRRGGIHASFGSGTPEEARVVASALRERIYATLTAIAALAALLPKDAHITAGGAVASVSVIVMGLWAASVFSEVVAHSVVHAGWPDRVGWLVLLRSSSQIFAAVILPVLLLVGAWIGWIDLEHAVVSGIVLLVLGIAALSWLALRSSGLKIMAKLGVVAAEMAIGLAIVLVKLLAH